jgi:hypothetical protein
MYVFSPYSASTFVPVSIPRSFPHLRSVFNDSVPAGRQINCSVQHEVGAAKTSRPGASVLSSDSVAASEM